MVHDIAGVAGVQAKLLRGAGHDVDEISLPRTGESWGWPAKGIALPFRVAAYRPAIDRLRNGAYDVIHIHWLTQGITGVLAGRPFIVQAHGSDVHAHLRNPVYRAVTRSVLKRAGAVLYVTPDLREPLKDFDSKLRYLPNPIDVDALAPRTMPTRVDRVLIFTRLDAVKGVDRIFAAVERLRPMVEITAVEWGELARPYARTYSRWVDFVAPVPHAEIGPFLQRFDAVIGQMGSGALGLSEIEALAAGRPVITGIDWNLYGDDDPPPVVRASDPDALVKAVEDLQQGRPDINALSGEGMAWTRRHHGFERHLSLLEAAYFDPRVTEKGRAKAK